MLPSWKFVPGGLSHYIQFCLEHFNKMHGQILPVLDNNMRHAMASPLGQESVSHLEVRAKCLSGAKLAMRCFDIAWHKCLPLL
jgi:hypothetical protein